jgi:hypothetical protein
LLQGEEAAKQFLARIGAELRRLGWIEKRTATARVWIRGSTAEAKADDQ